MLVVGVRQNVGALKSLLKVAENVVDDDNGLGSVAGTSDVCEGRKRKLVSRLVFALKGQQGGELTGLVASNILVGALGLVALGDNGGKVAAGGAVAAGRGHGRHVGWFVWLW